MEAMSTAKNMNREILGIGVPAFFETLFNTIATIIDSRMVAVMGVSAISSVAVTNQPRLFVYSVFFALNTVTTSLIAKYHGKGNRDAANRVLDHGLKLVLILSLVLSAAAVCLAEPIMLLFSGQADTLQDSVLYFRIVMAGMVFNLLFMEINSVLRGFGLTKLTFMDNLLSCAVNILGNYLLIEGHWGFPALGISGAALATVLGNAAACMLSFGFVCKRKLFTNIPYCFGKRYRMTRESLREMLSMAKSCLTDNLAMRATLLAISGITARIGSFQMAVYSVGVYLLNVNYALGTGLQTAAVTLIGKSYGQGDLKRLADYRKAITRLGLIGSAALAVCIMASGRLFFAFFSTDETFIEIGAASAVLIGVVTIFQSFKFIYDGFLKGVGMMKESMLCSVISFSCVNLGLVALLVLVLRTGIWGVWTGSLAAQAVQALLLYRYVRRTPVFQGGTTT